METLSATPIVRDYYDVPSSELYRVAGIYHGRIECIRSTTEEPQYSKKQNLIDSILRGWKLPKFYFLKLSDEPEEYDVVDGQQRLSAIFDFFDNELLLSDASAKEFGGGVYKALPDKVIDAFDDYEIVFDEIVDATEEEVKQLFQRLQDGLPLTSSEKLNSVHSRLRDFVRAQTKHPLFKKVSASKSAMATLTSLRKSRPLK